MRRGEAEQEAIALKKEQAKRRGRASITGSANSIPFAGRRQVRAAFDAGPISSDGGLHAPAAGRRRLGLTERSGARPCDWREKRRVEHSDLELIRQRIVRHLRRLPETGNDAKTMRRDPALKAACDRDPDQGADLASQPSAVRFENEVGPKELLFVARESSSNSRICSAAQATSFAAILDSYDRRPAATASRSFAISAPTTTSTFTNRCPDIADTTPATLIASVLQPGKSQGTRPGPFGSRPQAHHPPATQKVAGSVHSCQG